MGTEKRARQKANRQSKLAEVEAETTREVREASTKKFGKIAAVIAAIVAIFLLFNLLGGSDGDDQVVIGDSPEAEATSRPEVELASSLPSDFEPFAGQRGLTLVQPAARNDAYDSAPAMTIDPAKDYIAVLDTTAGEINLELFPEAAPLAVNNFVNLARDGFYDGVAFHRVLEGFMAQTGDPTASGSGGPGYSFADEFESGLAFDKPGQLAMANAGANTNGSQFFITFDRPDFLNNKHTIFGEVIRATPEGDAEASDQLVAGQEVLDAIVRVDPQSPNPDQPPLTVIESVRIFEN